jgi:MFS family permease
MKLGEIDEQDMSDADPEPSRQDWFYLLIITLIGTGYSWQKYSLAYAFGYQALDPAQHLDPKYEITAAYSELNAYYPILSGLAVLLPQMAFGIPMGTVADKVNRVTLLGIGCVLWSSTTLISGEVDSFWVFFGARVLLGVFTASC